MVYLHYLYCVKLRILFINLDIFQKIKVMHSIVVIKLENDKAPIRSLIQQQDT